MKINKMGTLKLAILLMYGQHKWLERTGPTLRLPNARLAGHFRTRAGRIREYLYELEDMGIIAQLRWNPHWTTLVIQPPINMAHNVGDVIDV